METFSCNLDILVQNEIENNTSDNIVIVIITEKCEFFYLYPSYNVE